MILLSVFHLYLHLSGLWVLDWVIRYMFAPFRLMGLQLDCSWTILILINLFMCIFHFILFRSSISDIFLIYDFRLLFHIFMYFYCDLVLSVSDAYRVPIDFGTYTILFYFLIQIWVWVTIVDVSLGLFFRDPEKEWVFWIRVDSLTFYCFWTIFTFFRVLVYFIIFSTLFSWI